MNMQSWNSIRILWQWDKYIMIILSYTCLLAFHLPSNNRSDKLIQMKMTIQMTASADQVQFMAHSMAKIRPVTNRPANHNRPLIPLNIKRDDLERILQLIKFMHWKVYSNRHIILMLSCAKNWAWIWAYQKPEFRYGFKIEEQNLENKKQDQEMINQYWIDLVHKITSTERG